MSWRGRRFGRGRSLIGVIALYAVLLQGLFASLASVPAWTPEHASICASRSAGGAPSAPDGTAGHDTSCCVLFCAGLAPLPSVPAAGPVARAPIAMAQRWAAVAPPARDLARTGVSARGPPVV